MSWLISFFSQTNPTAGSAKPGNPAATLSLRNLLCFSSGDDGVGGGIGLNMHPDGRVEGGYGFFLRG